MSSHRPRLPHEGWSLFSHLLLRLRLLLRWCHRPIRPRVQQQQQHLHQQLQTQHLHVHAHAQLEDQGDQEEGQPKCCGFIPKERR